jgi:hypothetical protein
MTAEEFFKDDARRLGYMPSDPHEPGNGRGLTDYYADHGMQSPRRERYVSMEKERTNYGGLIEDEVYVYFARRGDR